MSDIILGITGSRDFSLEGEKLIQEVIQDYCTNPDVKSIIFGGARGADTVALRAALNSRKDYIPKLIVALPVNVAYQPKDTHIITTQADEVIEMSLVGKSMYRIRNQYIVDNCTQLVAFWNRDEASGTAQTIRLAKAQKKLVEVYSL